MAQIIPPKPSTILPARGYERVDVERLEYHASPSQSLSVLPTAREGVRWLIIPLSMLLCVVQTVLTTFAGMRDLLMDSTLIPIVGFVMLFLIVLLINPCLRVSNALLGKWAGPLNRRELVCLFSAMLVTMGFTYGLSDPLLPMLAGPNNPQWNTPASGWSEGLAPSINQKLYIQDKDEIKAFETGAEATLKDAEGKPIAPPKVTAPWQTRMKYDWRLFQAIQWKLWITPLAYWLVFLASCYGIFYSLSYIVLSYWSDREKLIFPLARFFESIMPEPGQERYRIPRVLRNPGFWMGFALTFVIWAWNTEVNAGSLKNKGLFPIALGMLPGKVAEALKGGIFEGISVAGPGGFDANLRFLIIFTAIGIAFLLPLEVSFSVWFYYVLGRLILLIMMWSGRGQNLAAFPSDYYEKSNPLTSMGGGGMLLFSAICLFRCMRDYLSRVSGKSIGRRIVIGLPIAWFVIFVVVLVEWLHWNNMPLGWAAVFVAFLVLLVLGLMRIVAEAGIYWFQSHTSFFHLYRILGLGKYLAPTLLAPILPIYSALFLDTKAFMAPDLLNAAEMGKANQVNRVKFHTNLILCIALSVVVSLGLSIFLSHLWGAHKMEEWFYVENPPYILNAAQRLITDPPKFDMGNALWYGVGVVWLALTVFLRTTLFWFPHPIGFIMLINPMMAQLWFSFFIAWVCKKIVIRYGGKATYDRVRGFFIGLIAGELIAIVFWTSMVWLAGMTITPATSPSLNRYT